MIYIISILGALFGVAGWYMFWKGHAARFPQSGYVPPQTSWFGEFGMAAFAYLLTFLTVGKVKVIGKNKLPRGGRVIFAANHQLPCDFAMVRRGSGRHFRMLTAADQLGGFFGVLAACGGVISVAFKQKTDGQAAEQGCIRSVAAKNWRISFGVAVTLWLASAAGFVASLHFGMPWYALGAVVLALVVAGMPGSGPALGIFPQGALLPDDPDMKELFRPGAVRIGKAAASAAGEPVTIVPMAIHYKRDPNGADWTHRHLKGMRSMFLGTRNPKAWNPEFKKDLEAMTADERAESEAKRKEIMKAHKKSNVTNYGGVVVVGDPISIADLPEDPIEAIAIVRARIVELYETAKQH